MSEDVAGAWADLAEKSPKVRRVLEGGIAATGWTKALLVTSQLAAIILADLNVIPRKWLPLLMGMPSAGDSSPAGEEEEGPGDSPLAPPSEVIRQEEGATL